MVRKSPLQMLNAEIYNLHALEIGIKCVVTLCQEKAVMEDVNTKKKNYSKQYSTDPIKKDLKSCEEFFPSFGQFLKSKAAREWKSTQEDWSANFAAMLDAVKTDTTALYTAARGFADDSIGCYEKVFFNGLDKKRKRGEDGYEETADSRCNRFLANYTAMKDRIHDVAEACETLRQYRIVFSRYGLD